MRLRHKNREGAIIVLFAILLPILLVILGFSVDYAYMQKTRNETRVIADIGAKAAADTLARTGGDVDAAIAAAKFIGQNNFVAGSPLTLTNDQIVFGRATREDDGNYTINDWQTPFNSVTVSAERTKDSVEGPGDLFFGQLYGSPTFETVAQASSSFRDVEIILVLDRSGSMKFELLDELSAAEKREVICQLPTATSRWATLDSAVKAFLRELDSSPVKERVGLVTFASDATRTCNEGDITVTKSSLDVPLSTDLDLVRQEMDNRKRTVWFGATNIRAGIEEARLHFESSGSPEVDKIIVCLTDGLHNQGEGPLGQALLCAEAGITIHTITLGDGATQGQDAMLAIADATGGAQSHAPDAKTLENIFTRLAGSFAILTK